MTALRQRHSELEEITRSPRKEMPNKTAIRVKGTQRGRVTYQTGLQDSHNRVVERPLKSGLVRSNQWLAPELLSAR